MKSSLLTVFSKKNSNSSKSFCLKKITQINKENIINFKFFFNKKKFKKQILTN